MPPKSDAERQREYRQRLKVKNPDKLKDIMKKNSDRARDYYRKHIQNLTTEQKKEKRQGKRKKQNSEALSKDTVGELILEKEKVRVMIHKLYRKYKILKKQCHQQQQQIDDLQATCDNITTELDTLKTQKAGTLTQNETEVTTNEHC